MDVQAVIDFLLAVNWKEVFEALFAIIGGFTVLAKYTPWEWDNKVADFLAKLIHAGALNVGKPDAVIAQEEAAKAKKEG